MDIQNRISQEEITKTLDFCTNLFSTDWSPEAGSNALKKAAECPTETDAPGLALTDDEKVALDYINLTRKMHWNENITGKAVAADVVQGQKLRLERGKLGLERVSA